MLANVHSIMEKGRPSGTFEMFIQLCRIFSFNLVSSGTFIRDWSLNKGKPGAAGHIMGQYRSKKICCTYIRSGGSNRYCGKTQIASSMKKKSFIMWDFLLENVHDQTAVRKMWTWCVGRRRKKNFV